MELSIYAEGLSGDVRARYESKCDQVGVGDPYAIDESQLKFLYGGKLDEVQKDELPDFSYPDLFYYLTQKQSFYTGEQFKAYKSLEAHNQLTQGWLRYLGLMKLPNKEFFLVVGKVLHSQALSKPPLQPWIVIQQCGTVETAHCTCMAGLAEACTHIATVLFALEVTVKYVNERTCTSRPCYWAGPSTSKRAQFAEASDIDFSLPNKRMCVTPRSIMKTPLNVRHIPQPTSEETFKIYKRLKETGVKSAILSVVPGYAADFIPKNLSFNLPDSLKTLYNEDFVNLNYQELAKICVDIFDKLHTTQEQATVMEEATKKQSECKLWFEHRAGRITASNFKASCTADPLQPPISLIKRICYPERYKFSTDATRYGCSHEKDARIAYEQYLSRYHSEVRVTKSGLVLHPQYPYLGASPDGTVECSCCVGKGILEIKCPYCLKNEDLYTVVSRDKNFCIIALDDGRMQLSRKHRYYFQIQLQLLLSEADYCDFVVWRPGQDGLQQLFIERITPDTSWISEKLAAAKLFYIQCVLPELLGGWFSRPHKEITKPLITVVVTRC